MTQSKYNYKSPKAPSSTRHRAARPATAARPGWSGARYRGILGAMVGRSSVNGYLGTRYIYVNINIYPWMDGWGWEWEWDGMKWNGMDRMDLWRYVELCRIV